MTIPSTGITPEVIRGVMPLYTLSTDLLEGAFLAIPAPPADATTAWRHAHIARLVQEIGGLMPADAPQAWIAACSRPSAARPQRGAAAGCARAVRAGAAAEVA